jgi:hypothetical protein
LDSDSISILTCFLTLLLEVIWTTYPGNLYPIGLPDLTRSAYLNPARTACLNSIRVPYPSLTQTQRCLLGLIRSYQAELPYPILLPIRLLLTRPYTVLPGGITLPDSSPDLTSTYPAELSYPMSSRSNFYLPSHTRPPYLISLPGRVPPRCTQLLTRPYPITLPSWVPFNWSHPKNSSSASHLDLGLLLADNASR